MQAIVNDEKAQQYAWRTSHSIVDASHHDTGGPYSTHRKNMALNKTR